MQIKTFTYKLKMNGEYWLDGDLSMDAHVQKLVNAGWEPMNSASDPGHVRLGKTLVLTAMTGGLSLLFGASRTAQTITLTFKNASVFPTTNTPPQESGSVLGGATVGVWILAAVVLLLAWASHC